ncbi:MAG: hypothetical protein JKY01_03540 [Pseudomonadales bacterium]|nr:hypothetical protein [Pseudomonadales bacterium]
MADSLPTNTKVTISPTVLLLLVAIPMGFSGPIAVSIHQAVHILCAVNGECFGDKRWLEGISGLPMWNLLFGTGAAALFITSTLSYFALFPRLSRILQDIARSNGKEAPNGLPKLKKTALISMIFSSILWVAMLLISIYLYNKTAS